MPANERITDAIDVKFRVPGAMRTECDDLARTLDQPLAGILRLALRAGLPAVRAMAVTAPPIFEADNEVMT